MERPADDIFLVNDLSVLKSPVPKHLFLGRSSDPLVTNSSSSSPAINLGRTFLSTTPSSINLGVVKNSPFGLSKINEENVNRNLGGAMKPPVPILTSPLTLQNNKIYKPEPKQLTIPPPPVSSAIKPESILQSPTGQSATIPVQIKRKPGRPRKSDSQPIAKPNVKENSPVISKNNNIANTITVQTKDLSLQDKTMSPPLPSDPLSPKIITLTEWSMATVPNSPKLTGVPLEEHSYWVVLVGRRPDMAEAWHSSIVTERILANHIKTGSGRSLYILDSPMDRKEMSENGFSDKFVEAFKNGFPENWRPLLLAELTRIGKNLNNDTGNKRKAKTIDTPDKVKKSLDTPEKPVDSLEKKIKKLKEPKTEKQLKEGKRPKVEKQTLEIKRKRGRPPKSKSVEIMVGVDDIKEDIVNIEVVEVVASSTVEKKKRGRPRKNSLAVPTSTNPKPKKSPKPVRSPKMTKSPRSNAGEAKKVAPEVVLSEESSFSKVKSSRRGSSPGIIKWGWGGKAVVMRPGDDGR